MVKSEDIAKRIFKKRIFIAVPSHKKHKNATNASRFTYNKAGETDLFVTWGAVATPTEISVPTLSMT